MSDVTGHNHDESGAPTYPDYRDRCPVGCDDLTPVRMADTNVQYVGKDRLVTRRLVLDGPSQFAKITPPRTPTTLDAAWEALEIDLDDDHRVMSVIARHRPLIEAEARASLDVLNARIAWEDVLDGLEVALSYPAEMEVNRERWRAARINLLAALAALEEPTPCRCVTWNGVRQPTFDCPVHSYDIEYAGRAALEEPTDD